MSHYQPVYDGHQDDQQQYQFNTPQSSGPNYVPQNAPVTLPSSIAPPIPPYPASQAQHDPRAGSSFSQSMSYPNFPTQPGYSSATSPPPAPVFSPPPDPRRDTPLQTGESWAPASLGSFQPNVPSGYLSPPPGGRMSVSQSQPAMNAIASSQQQQRPGGPRVTPVPVSSVYEPRYSPAPYPSPGYDTDLYGAVNNSDDWNPSRISMQDDSVALLPRDSSSTRLPGGWQDGDITANQDEDEDLTHYGPIPARIPRRNKTIKRVKLYHGHLVLDNPVPTKILDVSREKTEKEFNTLRYTAATGDPNDFKDEHYTLRQMLYDPPRRTELFIVLTMYNEDDELFLRTMRGVMQNIDYLCKKSRSSTWGPDGWKKVVVCIVSDGRSKINPRTLACIQKLGAYQPGMAKNVVNGKPVTAHIYEYTTQFRVSSRLTIEPANDGSVPVQLLFCLKEKNQKKLNSHRWFFNAFGKILMPNVCVLIDVGTQPGPTSIYHLWKSFDLNSEVGGACGEIVTLKGKFWSALFKNPLVAAQNFEYKMSNILDKPLESVFGFIAVLPGAFSAYRYIAIQNDETGEGPLKQYFLGETMHGANAGIFDANMYLAEDRILCWELVSKRNSRWHLHYVKSATGTTDVPDTIPDLVSQRRRWLNGSFFASIHATYHFYYIYRSRHSTGRKIALHILILYQAIQLIFSWFAIGNYFIAFYVLTKSMETYTAALKWVNIPLLYCYVGLTVACFLMALGNRPKGSKVGYTLAFIGFAILTAYMTFAAFYISFRSIQAMKSESGFKFSDLVKNKTFIEIVLSLLSTFGVYLLASLIHYDPWHIFTSMIQYLLIAPSYISVMNVYAFANVHDVSWGTKGQDKVATDLGVVKSGTGEHQNTAEIPLTLEATDLNAEYNDALHILQSKPEPEVQVMKPEELQEDYYKSFRTRVLLAWVLSNGFLIAVVLTATDTFGTSTTASGDIEESTSIYLAIVLYAMLALALFRFCGSVTYIIIRMFIGE